jgi:hypothetical protein
MSKDLDDRLSRRFGDEENEESSQDAQETESDESSQSSQSSQKAQNIKKAWNVRSFYLDDDLNDELTNAFKRLDLDLSEAGSGVDLKKTRHFYPLIVELGLEHLEEMDLTEITERLEGNE